MTTTGPSGDASIREIAVMLSNRAEALCRDLLPAGHREGQEWVEARRAKGGLGDSLSVRLAGEKRGVWGHFVADVGGDALDLVAYVLGLKKGEAVKWAKTWLGVHGVPQAPSRELKRSSAHRPDPRQDDAAARQRAALKIWHQGKPASGTLVEIYLGARSISIPPPPTLRFSPALKHGPTGLPLPAMVAAVQGPDRYLVGVHRTFLTMDGRGKAQVRQPKMSLGEVAGGAVRLAAAGPRLGIVEGIESGLSAMELYPGLPVWAVLSVSNMGAVALPETVREVVLLLDGDAPGSPADKTAGKAALELMRRGLKVSTIRPPEDKDLNDLLREETPAPGLVKEARGVVA